MEKKAPNPELPKIYAIRREKVVLDADLAKLYGVPTKRLNEAVRRNAASFPKDSCFTTTREEVANLRSQIATASLSGDAIIRSQIATEPEHGGRRSEPRVFTEHGALMAGNVLRSEQAMQMSLYLVRAFVASRERLAVDLGTLRRLAEIDKKPIEHDAVPREVLERLQPLLNPPPPPKKPLIGFHPGDR